MTDISKQPWFHGLLPREDVKAMLKTTGDYLVRTSEPVAGRARHLILSLMQNQNDAEGARHYVICEDSGKYSVVEDKIFTSIIELLDYYKTNQINTKDETSLLITPISRQFWELAHENITLTKTLGEGAFGEVKKGTLRTNDGMVDVAVKVAKLEKCTKEQIKEIMAEARLMRNFDHKNVVKCYGTAAGQEPLMVVMELVPGGGLDSYLTKNRVALDVKLDIVSQVAQGLEYIHKQEVIHRDIAARNCLYGNGIVKVSDFGLSRRGTTYQMNPKNKVPIRWLAPETLATFIYSGPSDIFAFGILCWEVLENGKQPYPDMTVAQVHQKVLREDYRMSIPLDAPSELGELIKKCWLTQPSNRPTSESIVKTMSTMAMRKKSTFDSAANFPTARAVSEGGGGSGSSSGNPSPMQEKSLPDDDDATKQTTTTGTTGTGQHTNRQRNAATSRGQTPSRAKGVSRVSQASQGASTVTGGGGKKKKRRNRFLDRGNPLHSATNNLSVTQSQEDPPSQGADNGNKKASCQMMLGAEKKSKSKFQEKKSGFFGKKKKRSSTNLKW